MRMTQWAVTVLIIGTMVTVTGCSKKGRKKSNVAAGETPLFAHATGSSSPSKSSSTALGMLPKENTAWLEVPHPRTSTDKLGLTGGKDGLVQHLMGEDGNKIKKHLGVDLASDAGIRATGVALDRPVGIALSLSPNTSQRLNKRMSFFVYAHLHSASDFRTTLVTLAQKTGLSTIQSEDLGSDQSIISIGDGCIAIKDDVAMFVLEPNGKQSGTTPCREALARSREDSLLSVAPARKASKSKSDLRAYHSSDLVGTAIRHAIHRFGPRGSNKSAPLKGHAIAIATIPTGGHMTYSGRIEKNRVVAEMDAMTPGKGLIPDLIQNTKPPAWRGYILEKPAFVAEAKLNVNALVDWGTTVSSSLGLNAAPVLEILRKSGVTGRLGGYVTMVSPDSKGEDFPMPKLSAFAEISDTKVVGDLIGSFMIRSDNSDGPTWSLPGPNGQVMWLALRRKTLVFTTDVDVLRRSAKSPSPAQWRLPNDSVKQSGVLRVSIPSIAWLVMSYGDRGAVSAPNVEATWSKDPEVAQLVKELQVLRDEEAKQAREWRKEEQGAVEAFWGTLGDIQVLGTRSSKGVHVEASWQIDHDSWAQLSRKGMTLFDEMKEKKRAHNKRWHQGSLKREVLMLKIQKRSR